MILPNIQTNADGSFDITLSNGAQLHADNLASLVHHLNLLCCKSVGAKS